MLYLITQFQQEDLQREEYAKQATGFNEKLQELGCQLLTHSDQWDIFVYRLDENYEGKVRELCTGFTQYTKQIFHGDLLFDIFTREEIEDGAFFSKEFIEALGAAEGNEA